MTIAARVGQPAAGTGSGRTGVTGPGVTPTTITIGLVYITNSEAADKAFGANGITNGDDQADNGLDPERAQGLERTPGIRPRRAV